MRTMTVSKCGNSRWLEQPALLFRVRLDARGGARCANRLVGVFARLIWKGRGAGRGGRSNAILVAIEKTGSVS